VEEAGGQEEEEGRLGVTFYFPLLLELEDGEKEGGGEGGFNTKNVSCWTQKGLFSGRGRAKKVGAEEKKYVALSLSRGRKKEIPLQTSSSSSALPSSSPKSSARAVLFRPSPLSPAGERRPFLSLFFRPSLSIFLRPRAPKRPPRQPTRTRGRP